MSDKTNDNQVSERKRSARYHGKLAQALSDLNRLLARHNNQKVRGSKGRSATSFATQQARARTLEQGIRDLHGAGLKIRKLSNLGMRHMRVLVETWEARGYSPATIQNKFSHWAVLCRWIGKAGMIRDPRGLLSDPKRYDRIYQATRDKSWEGQAVTPEEKIAAVMDRDAVVGVQLCLCHVFGLRPKEAWLLQPHSADLGDRLVVSRGTKGGRRREVPIDTDAQRQVLEMARALAPLPQGSTIPQKYDLKGWKNHFYYVLQCCGITRRDGIVAHGLRHGYANRLYEDEAGEPSPVRGGEAGSVAPWTDHAARLRVAQDLGHGRKRISTAYLGAVLQRYRCQGEPPEK